jgi:hypothetical protein
MDPEEYDFSAIDRTPPSYEEFDYSYGEQFKVDRLKAPLPLLRSRGMRMGPRCHTLLSLPWVAAARMSWY